MLIAFVFKLEVSFKLYAAQNQCFCIATQTSDEV